MIESVQIRGSKRLGCNAGCQEFSRCRTRGESLHACKEVPGFEIQDIHDQKSKTWVSVAQQKELMFSNLKKRVLKTGCKTFSRQHRKEGTLEYQHWFGTDHVAQWIFAHPILSLCFFRIFLINLIWCLAVKYGKYTVLTSFNSSGKLRHILH